jgi:hypothetical protein
MKKVPVIVIALLCVGLSARAGLLAVEPDDYPDETTITNIVPGITFTITGDDNVPFPSVIHATVDVDGFGFAPTGSQVFGHSNVPFFNDGRRLRMDFAAPVAGVSIDFSGSLTAHIGRLDIYNEAGVLLDTYLTQPRASGRVG